MVVYGRQAVREALRGPRAVHRVFATGSAARTGWLEGVALEVVPEARIEALAASRDHQGMCAEADPYPYADAAGLLVALPVRGRIGSLNVSTAAAALLYGILHFRSQHT